MAGATDADWVVKLIDVFPADEPSALTMSGYELMVTSSAAATARATMSLGRSPPTSPWSTRSRFRM